MATPQEILAMINASRPPQAAPAAPDMPAGDLYTPEGLASLASGLGQTYGPLHEQATRIAWGLDSANGASPEVMKRLSDIQAGKYNTVNGPHPLMKLGFAAIMAGGGASALGSLGGAGAAGASAGGTAGGGLGSGLGVGSTASGLGGGALGTGLVSGTASSSIGGGALGSGLGAGIGSAGSLAAGGAAGLGALGSGYFTGETAALPALTGGGGAASIGATAPAVGAASVPAAGGVASAGGLGSILSNPQALGALGGLALGGLGGSKQAGTITVEEGIPDWLQPYIKPQLDKYSSLVQNYQTDPYGVMPEAMNQFKDTISGRFLDPSTNKYLEQYFNLGAERVKGSLSPSFGHMQAFGSHSGYNEALSRGLGDLATNLYGGAYEKERDRQNQMIAQAPNFLTGASQSAFAPYQSYLNTVGSLGKKKTEPYFDNPFGNMLGGAMTGYGLGGLFK